MVIEPSGCKKHTLAYFSFTWCPACTAALYENMATSVSYAKRALICEWMITWMFSNKIATMCYMDERSLFLLFPSDSLWMICLVLLKNNLINNEASNIRIETASAKPVVLPKQDGQGLKWVFKQICHNVLRGRTEPTSSFSLPILFLDLSIQQRTGEWLTWHLSTHFSSLPSCSGRTACWAEAVLILILLASLLIRLFFKRTKQIIN